MGYTLWITAFHPSEVEPVETDISLVDIQKIITMKAREAQGKQTSLELRETFIEKGGYRVINYGSNEDYIIYQKNKK